MASMQFEEYKSVTIEPELGISIEEVADEIMNKMASKGWQVVTVCPHPRAGKLLITFGKPKQ